MQATFSKTVLFLLISSLLITVCYFYVDRQVVWFLAAHHSRQYGILRLFADDILFVISDIIFLYYIYFLVMLSNGRVRQFDQKFIVACNSVVVALFIKDVLKYVFGRYWPSTFVCDNLSLVKNHAYGYNWFQSGDTYASFPSGHLSFIFSFTVSMWFLFPRYRWLWSLLALLVIVGQVGMYYHFVSDVIAGITLGSLVGFYNVYYYRVNKTAASIN